ncbi:hypothetical protein GCM10029964_070650 [Kibdelosporangium lantanae]
MVRKLTALVSGLGLVAGCAAAGSDQPAPDQRATHVLVAADDTGAIVFDTTGVLHGVNRDGTEAWSDRRALTVGADARCLAHCPDAVFSGVDDPIDSWQVVAGHNTPFAPATRVLTARSTSDAVYADGSGLRITRPDGTEEIPVGIGVAWAENTDHTAAVTYSTDSAGPVRRFAHTADGWHRLPDGPSVERGWAACVVGATVVVTGEKPVVVQEGQSVPIRTDLRSVGSARSARPEVLSWSGPWTAVSGAGPPSGVSVRMVGRRGRVTCSVRRRCPPRPMGNGSRWRPTGNSTLWMGRGGLLRAGRAWSRCGSPRREPWSR